MTDRPLFAARRTAVGSPHREVVNHNLERVAFVPAGTTQPQVLDRRAGIIAAALLHDSLSAETISIRDVSTAEGATVQVWDGGILLVDISYENTVDDIASVGADVYQRSRHMAVTRANALADGYLLARRLCLGERT